MLTLMPCTVAVVRMMNITSSTYARSSIGVMLMSSYGLFLAWTFIACSSDVVLGQLVHELVGEHVSLGVDGADPRAEPVVGEHRGNRDAKASNGRDERRRDAGRDRVDVHVAARGDRCERDHHADDRAEQPEERAAADRDREQDHAIVELLLLA